MNAFFDHSEPVDISRIVSQLQGQGSSIDFPLDSLPFETDVPSAVLALAKHRLSAFSVVQVINRAQESERQAMITEVLTEKLVEDLLWDGFGQYVLLGTFLRH